MMVGSNLKEDQLQQIVDKTILQVHSTQCLVVILQCKHSSVNTSVHQWSYFWWLQLISWATDLRELVNNQHQSDSPFIMLFSLTRTLTVWSTTKNSAISWVRILCYSFVNLIKSIFGFGMKKRSGTKSGADIIWQVWIRKSDFLSKYWASMDLHVYNHFQFHFIFFWFKAAAVGAFEFEFETGFWKCD